MGDSLLQALEKLFEKLSSQPGQLRGVKQNHQIPVPGLADIDDALTFFKRSTQ